MGLTIIMVTHNLDIVAETDRVIRLAGGRIEVAENVAVEPYSSAYRNGNPLRSLCLRRRRNVKRRTCAAGRGSWS